jgi:Ca-activated chloride channel family protein
MDEQTGRVVTDRRGNVYYQRMPVSFNEKGLREVANIADGKFYRATDTQSLEDIYRDIDKLEKTTISARKYQQYRDLFPACIAAGCALLIGQLLLGQTIWKRLP